MYVCMYVCVCIHVCVCVCAKFFFCDVVLVFFVFHGWCVWVSVCVCMRHAIHTHTTNTNLSPPMSPHLLLDLNSRLQTRTCIQRRKDLSTSDRSRILAQQDKHEWYIAKNNEPFASRYKWVFSSQYVSLLAL
jgi:hypothetical protein